ncbi:hypothetical protein DRJ17_04350 [Candidatus Woesearchaeota archaeon]|nr:MAG: hypothetical protein DRJ17_04350 [Candidatus Woesearchaeota archaeon]
MERKIKSLPFLLTALLLLSPIVWLPGITAYQFKVFKSGILLLFLLQPIVLLASRGFRLDSGKEFRGLFIWLAIFVLLSATGFILAQEHWTALKAYIRYLITIPLFLNMYMIFRTNPNRAERAFKLMVVPVFISCVLVLVAHLDIMHIKIWGEYQSFETGDRGYVRGLFGRRGGQSWAIGFVVPIACYYAIKSKNTREKFAWLSAFIAMIYSGSILENRGGFIAALASSIVVIYLIVRRKNKLYRYALLLLTIVAIVFYRENLIKYFFYDLRGIDYYGWDSSYDGLTNVSSGRWERWVEAVEIVSRYPLTGIGFVQEDIPGLSFEHTRYFHNFMIDNIVYTGIFSIIALFIFIGKVVALTIRRLESIGGGASGDLIIVSVGIFVAFSVNMLVEYGSMFTAIFTGISFWVALAALCAMPENTVKYVQVSRKRV